MIDDDLDILAGTSFLLSPQFQVETFDNGWVALEYLHHRPCDLILLDLLMPRIDGTQFLAELDRMHLEIPTIVMTASSNCQFLLRNSRFTSLITKPFTIEDLEALIEKVLSRNKLASPALAF